MAVWPSEEWSKEYMKPDRYRVPGTEFLDELPPERLGELWDDGQPVVVRE